MVLVEEDERVAFRDGAVRRLPDEDVLQLPDVRLSDLDGVVAVRRHNFRADFEMVVRGVPGLEPSLLAAGSVLSFLSLVVGSLPRLEAAVEAAADVVACLGLFDLRLGVARSESVVHELLECCGGFSFRVLSDKVQDLIREQARTFSDEPPARHAVRQLVVLSVGVDLFGRERDAEALAHELSKRGVAPAFDIGRDKFALFGCIAMRH